MKTMEARQGTPRRVLPRIIQGIVALAGAFYVFAGAALLFAPFWFFQTLGNFGPFNQHYEGDVGAFLLPLGLGLLVAAYQPTKHYLLLWVGAIASLAHACNHLYADLIGQPSLAHLLNETLLLFVLAAALLWAAIRSTIEQRQHVH